MTLRQELLSIISKAVTSLVKHIENCKSCKDVDGRGVFCEEGKALAKNYKDVCARSRALIGFPTKEQEVSLDE